MYKQIDTYKSFLLNPFYIPERNKHFPEYKNNKEKDVYDSLDLTKY